MLRHLKLTFILQVFNTQKYNLKKVSPPVDISALRFLQTILLERKNSVSPKGNRHTESGNEATLCPHAGSTKEFHNRGPLSIVER